MGELPVREVSRRLGRSDWCRAAGWAAGQIARLQRPAQSHVQTLGPKYTPPIPTNPPKTLLRVSDLVARHARTQTHTHTTHFS